jgi:hypothetical protein
MSAAAGVARKHIHLPSVHVRDEEETGFDFEEDLFVIGRGRRQRVERVIRLAMIEGGREMRVSETRDELCPGELYQLQDDLPVLMDEGNPAARAMMEECARLECERQIRIAAGEDVCLGCGCSTTRACSGGCCWATSNLCSRCALKPRAEQFIRYFDARLIPLESVGKKAV